MKVEILFSDLGFYYGDYGNIIYLSKCLKDAQFIYTNNLDKPYFIDNDVDMVYIGSLSESKQLIAIERLMKYRDKLKQKINSNTIFLFTGNSIEILGKYIEDKDNKIECLGLYDFYSKRDLNKRINYLFKGKYEDLDIVGNKSQYSLIYSNDTNTFINVEKGLGNNINDNYEGIKDHNLYATYLLGPFLVLNPLFTEKLIKLINPNNELAYRKEVIDAYNLRLKQMDNPKLDYHLHEH